MLSIQKSALLFSFLLWVSLVGYAQQPKPSPSPDSVGSQPAIKSFQVNSDLMGRPIPYNVIFPANYEIDKEARFPVIYMMHGLGGSHKITKLTSAKYTDKQRVIMVFLEGGTGFYTDSATKPADKWESYIIKELIPEVDKNFRTVADRRGRAVAGASMGGYGALKFGIKYPQLFSLAVSWSGAVNVTAFHDATDLPSIPFLKQTLTTVFGDGEDRATVHANDLFKLFSEYPTEKIRDLPFFYLDCGTEDELGLFKPNRDLAGIMFDRKIPHEYRQFPGGHDVFPANTFPDLYDLSTRIFAKQLAAQGSK
ncbi:MAG: hypothetical protein KF831_02025 [Acidobacteria bacterium]|nr:hypothetical protein [Acidobacteriota bacterium]